MFVLVISPQLKICGVVTGQTKGKLAPKGTTGIMKFQVSVDTCMSGSIHGNGCGQCSSAI